jgi:hypothetical protein
VNVGVQVYLRCPAEGAIGFVFGQHGAAHFRDTTIGIAAPANTTTSGRATNDSGLYLSERSVVVPAPHVWANTSGNVCFGRPWGHYVRVVFKDMDTQEQMAPRMVSAARFVVLLSQPPPQSRPGPSPVHTLVNLLHDMEAP